MGNVPAVLDSDTLRSIFDPFGAVAECSLPPDPVTGGHRGYGFVSFAHPKVTMIDKWGIIDIFGRLPALAAAFFCRDDRLRRLRPLASRHH